MTTSAATLLRSARRTHGLTQRALGARTGTSQPSIASVESGRHDTTVETLGALLRATGQRLVTFPTTARTASETADAVYEALRAGGQRRAAIAYRELLQWNDDLAASPSATRVALCVTPPAPTGDRRWDAFLGALAAHHLDGLPQPDWVKDGHTLAEPWYLSSNPYLRESSAAETPKAFGRRNIFVSYRELESV